jgi:hypothetical protein
MLSLQSKKPKLHEKVTNIQKNRKWNWLKDGGTNLRMPRVPGSFRAVLYLAGLTTCPDDISRYLENEWRFRVGLLINSSEKKHAWYGDADGSEKKIVILILT